MTNERAIELLKRISDSQFDGIHGDERREALSMAVRALVEPNIGQKTIDCIIKRLNDEDNTVGDTIYRQDAIDAVDIKCLHRGIVKGIQGIIEDLPSAQPTQTNADSTHENTLDCVSRQQVIDGIKKEILKGDRRSYKGLLVANHVILHLPSVQPELIEQGAYVRGFEQGRTQGMIDAKEGKK